MAKLFACSFGRYHLQLRLSRQPIARVIASRDRIALGFAQALESRFPQLREFGFSLTKENAAEVGEFYSDYLPLFHRPSRSAGLRSLLSRLRHRTKDAAVKDAATVAIAVSDLQDGLPDRALALKDHPQHAADWAAHLDRFEAAYGTALVRDDWSSASRGKSLIAYFETHSEILRDKAVLHFAPEGDLRSWIETNRERLGITRYVTTDGFLPTVDEQHDITALDIPAQAYDVIICHRVMEHVLDDISGFAELFRVLRPGGLLSFSVPQAPHQSETKEWVKPDESHHGHVRHYGIDLEARMRAAGFEVAFEPWLLQQAPDFLREQGAYPMRILHAWREPSTTAPD